MKENCVVAFALSLAVAASSWAAPRDSQWRGKVTEEVLKNMKGGASAISVIVLLHDQTETNPALSKMSIAENLGAFELEAETRVQEVVDTVPAADLAVKHRYRSFSGFSGEATPEAIERIARHPLVRLVIPNSKVYPARIQGNGLMRIPQVVGQGVRGAGVTVAVIDDGVAWDHPELGGGTTFPNDVVIGGFDFVLNVTDPSPDRQSDGQLQSHGTSVAGIIAGRGDGAGGMGVAPEARIVGLRVLGLDGGKNADIIAAIDWSVSNRTRVSPPISILNMSIQGKDYTAQCDNEPEEAGYKVAVDRAVAAGLAVVVATGNHGMVGHSTPGCLSKVISVSSVYDANVGAKQGFVTEQNEDGTPKRTCDDLTTAADQVPCYANIASFTTLLAPAEDARSPKAGGGYDDTFGGTSAATPYAAGAIALLRSAFPNRSNAELVSALRSTGTSVFDPLSGVRVPRINLDSAHLSLGGTGGGPPPPGPCVVNPTTLCLSSGRFKVQSRYTLADGRNGQGQAVSITGDTGFFWFFDAANVEMVLKLVNACSFASRYWVFAGGLTNVQVDTTVTDTKTGTVKQYQNPQGTAFQPVQDTNAFATCP